MGDRIGRVVHLTWPRLIRKTLVSKMFLNVMFFFISNAMGIIATTHDAITYLIPMVSPLRAGASLAIFIGLLFFFCFFDESCRCRRFVVGVVDVV